MTLFALKLNQTVTDKFNRYSWPIYWSSAKNTLHTESHSEHLFVWKFINFGIIACVMFPCSLFVLFDAFKNTGKYDTFQILLSAIQALMCVCTFGFCCVLWTFRFEIVLGVNALNLLESIIPPYKTACKPKCKWFEKRSSKAKIYLFLSHVYEQIFFNGSIDFVGITSIIAVPIFWSCSIFISFVGIYLNLDSTYYFLKTCLPIYTQKPILNEFITFLRFIILYSTCLDMCTTCRTFAILGIAFVEAFKKYLSRLTELPPSFQKGRSLQIEFQVANIPVSKFLCIALANMFLMEVITVSGSILAFGIMPWYKYIIFPFAMIFAVVLMSQLFREIIYVHRKFLVVKSRWIVWCALIRNRNRFRFTLRMANRIFRSMKPLAFTYSSLGQFTTGTRTDFYHRILEYSMGAL